MIPEMIFFTRGKGLHKDKLVSFENALRNAKIEKFNLVKVSSIFPPGCRVVPLETGLQHLSAGQIVFCVMDKLQCEKKGTHITSAVGLVHPADERIHGYLAEYHTMNGDEKDAGEKVVEMAREMVCSSAQSGKTVAQDVEGKMTIQSAEQFKTSSIIQTAFVEESGKWYTVVTAGVFIIQSI